MAEAGSADNTKKEAPERPKRSRVAESDMFGHIELCDEEYQKAHFLVPLSGNEHHFATLDLLEGATAIELAKIAQLLDRLGALELGPKLKLKSGQMITKSWYFDVITEDDDEDQ
jgi:hypothetical protein